MPPDDPSAPQLSLSFAPKRPVKAVIDFTDLKAGALAVTAKEVRRGLSENMVFFSKMPVTLEALDTRITEYNQKLVARASRARADVMAFRLARKALERDLRALGTYVNIVAAGDASVVEMSGFPYYETRRPPSTRPPGAPQNLRLRHGILSGTIQALFKTERRGCANEVQITEGNPDEESGWHTRAFCKSGRLLLKGFTPGMVYWVRVRSLGNKGMMGPWSDPAQIRAL